MIEASVFILFGVIVLSAASYILIDVAKWFIFKKAGQKPWKSLIPFYNIYMLHKIVWETATFWISMGMIICGAVLEALFHQSTAVLVITTLLETAGTVLELIEAVKIAKSFGKSTAFGFGNFFLPFIFLPIIAFGKAEYIGPEGKPEKE